MVIVHNTDMYKYIDKHRKVESIRYLNGVKQIYECEAVYLPKSLYDGDGLIDNIVKFVSDNQNTIKNIAGFASTVADGVKKIGTNTINVVRKIKELRHKPAITDDAINKVLNANAIDTPKTGNGFFYF